MKTNERILREHIDKLVRESISMLNEKSHSIDKRIEKKSGKKKRELSKKKEKVLDKLEDPMTNDAELMRQLWHPKSKDEEDAMRSEFSKKAREVKNDNGSKYHFSPEEIVTLYNKLS